MADALLAAQMRTTNCIINFIKNTIGKKGQSAQTVPYFEARLKLLERYYNDMYNRHAELLPFEKDNGAHEYFADATYQIAELAYLDAVAEINSGINWLRAPANASVSNQQSGATPVNPAPKIENVKVPRVTLSTFTGVQSEWETFKQRFTSLTINKREYADVDKLQYLLSSLDGKAAKGLSGIQVTDANFKVAWDKLVERYDNSRKRLANHLDSLIQLPALRSRQIQDLEDLLDAVIVAVRGLQDLGCPIEQYDNWFVHCITIKLDPITREAWEISQEDKEGFYSYSDLLSFLKRRFQSLDSAQSKTENRTVGGSPPKSNNSSYQKCKKSDTALVNTAGVSEQNSSSNKGSSVCYVCQGKHSLHSCEQFKKMTPQEQFSLSKKAKLCLNCLRKEHSVSDCKSLNRCFVRKMQHHTKLHFDTKSSNPESNSKEEIQSESSPTNSDSTAISNAYLATARRSILLATATIIVCDRFGSELSVRALIDPGAQRSFISERIAAQLTLDRRSVSVSILGVGGQSTSHARGEVTVTLRSRIDKEFNCVCSALVLPKLTGLLPSQALARKDWPHISGLQLADPNYFSPTKIDLILGADLYGIILQDGFVRGPADAPIAQNTVFGWILTGIVESQLPSLDSSRVSACHTIADSSLSQTLVKFWEIEEIPSTQKLSPEEEYCVQYFASTTVRNSEGRFVVRLPFSRRETFPDSRDIAVACLRRFEKRRARDPELQSAYSKFMSEYVQLGHMKLAETPPADDYHFYLPHHRVFRADSNKIRVVFNASQKTSSGFSLNDALLPGPKLQPDITLVITRWRFFCVAAVTDIVKMFRQYLVHKDDLNWQRLVWRDLINQIIQDYVALTVTYGTTSAPFLAVSAILQLAKDGKISHPLVYIILCELTYIDDIFFGADNTELATKIRDQLIDLLATAGMKLGKWSSNQPELLEGLQGNDVCDLPSASEDIVSTLGLKWDTRKDSFLLSTSLPRLPASITKRTILSDTARLFDPLGFIAPVIIQAKILLQDLWIQKLDWDDPLQRDLLDRWLDFRNSLIHLSKIRIPRWIGTLSEAVWHLHGFADASMRAYAAVVYAVVPGSTPVILMAKTRVAPVETLPRLELCAATLLARLATHLVTGVLQAPASVNFWSDSKVVLDWLSGHPSRWPTFIANRVSEITTKFPDAAWRHVRSKDNPADCASRGLAPSELVNFSLWWRGPEWLPSLSPEWPAQIHFAQGEPQDDSINDEDVLTMLEKSSSFSKVIRVVAVSGKQLSPSSPLARLSPFIDAQGSLRVGGRLHNAALPYSERHPLILPGCCYFVKLLVEETHRVTLHGGAQLMKSVLNRSYWIIGGNRLITGVYHRCVTCIRFGATPLQQQMAPLPADRLSQGRPFQTTGLDYAGPFPILFSKGRGAKSTKGYWFTARRGLCNKLLSDNGTTFKGADAELRRLLAETSMFSAEICAQLAGQQIEWKFIPPRAPHFGGLWEAAVRSFKYYLRRIIGGSTLTFEEFSTLAAKIEACLNSRPLCPLSNEAHDPVALTPGHFLVGSALLVFPEPVGDSTPKMTFKFRWQLLNQLRDCFWHRWRKEVLAQLQQRNKWLKLQPNLQPGDLVIITDELSPPAVWPLAVVTQTHPGQDGRVRVVFLRTSKTSLVRPTVKLLRLPQDDQTAAYHALFIGVTSLDH